MSQKEINKFELLLLLIFITGLGILMILCLAIGQQSAVQYPDEITIREEELADWRASAHYYEALLEGRGLIGE